GSGARGAEGGKGDRSAGDVVPRHGGAEGVGPHGVAQRPAAHGGHHGLLPLAARPLGGKGRFPGMLGRQRVVGRRVGQEHEARLVAAHERPCAACERRRGGFRGSSEDRAVAQHRGGTIGSPLRRR
ncbi:MAG: hypothetical protein ACK559_00960, partial [bacterium]